MWAGSRPSSSQTLRTAEYASFRNESERLRGAGVPTTVSRRAGMIHGFLFFPGLVRAADAVLDEACAWLRGASSGSP